MDTIPSYEKEHVINIYNDKCEEFDRARYAIWAEVEAYLSTLEKGISILEVGCGNGKNMRGDYVWTGCDASEKLVNVCIGKQLNVSIADACNLPYKDESFDAVISIAVIHHLSTVERRIQAVSEITRVLKPGGTCFITVLKSSKSCNKTFKLGGVKRYYHLFEDGEFDKLVDKRLNIVSVSSNRLNWYYTLIKKGIFTII
jgi:ubiquinone/menaquinone biosynthesis C-methylase UbiE